MTFLVSMLLALAEPREPFQGADGISITDSLSFRTSYRTAVDSTGETIRKIVNTRLSELEMADSRALLAETITNTWWPGLEGAFGHISLVLWRLPRQAGDRPVWSREYDGNEGCVAGELYKVTEWGCCDERPTDIHYSLASGLALLRSTSPIWTVRGLLPQPVYAGFSASDYGPEPIPRFRRQGPHVIGVLTIVTETDTLAWLRFHAPSESVSYSESLRLAGEDVSVNDEARIARIRGNDAQGSNKTVTLSFLLDLSHPLDAATFLLPLSPEGIDLSGSVVPEGFKIETLLDP